MYICETLGLKMVADYWNSVSDLSSSQCSSHCLQPSGTGAWQQLLQLWRPC